MKKLKTDLFKKYFELLQGIYENVLYKTISNFSLKKQIFMGAIMKKNCVFMCMLMFLSSFVLAENDETGSEEVEQVKKRIDILGEEMKLEITGFFDVQAIRMKETENIFGLGPFELDLDTSYNEHVTMSAAIVIKDGETEIGPGYIDFHLLKPTNLRHNQENQILTEPGFHIKIGCFDVPFGIDYLFYASPDRLTISAPLYTDNLNFFDGGWTDIGIQLYKTHPLYNVTAYVVAGYDTGNATGGRLGISPFENPLSEDYDEEAPVFEFGLSGVHDVDRDLKSEYSIWGADLELNYSDALVLCEYVQSNSILDNIDQRSYYAQIQYPIQPLELDAYCRFDGYNETNKKIDDELLTNHVTLGLSKELYGVSILKIEYQYFPEDHNGLSGHNDLISTQLVINF